MCSGPGANLHRAFLCAGGLVGIGEAAYAPAAQAMISDSFPVEHRALTQAIFASGIAARRRRPDWRWAELWESVHGWQYAFLIVGAIGIIPGLSAFKLKEPPKRPRSEVVFHRALVKCASLCGHDDLPGPASHSRRSRL